MTFEPILGRMASFPAALDVLLLDLPEGDARWRPGHGGWSILEIVSHLVEEEFRDFRTRLALTLDDPNTPWPPIDPEGWASSRAYNEGDLVERLDAFTVERDASLRWLRSLVDPDWECAHFHRDLGSLKAGDLLVSWARHDALHLRQVSKRLLELAERDGTGFDGAYAGPW